MMQRYDDDDDSLAREGAREGGRFFNNSLPEVNDPVAWERDARASLIITGL